MACLGIDLQQQNTRCFKHCQASVALQLQAYDVAQTYNFLSAAAKLVQADSWVITQVNQPNKLQSFSNQTISLPCKEHPQQWGLPCMKN